MNTSMAVTGPARDVADAEARVERHLESRMKIDAQQTTVQVGENMCVVFCDYLSHQI